MTDFLLMKMELVGFRTYLERTTLNFDGLSPGLHYLKGENLDEPDLGSNGSGKSTLWDALCWCLQGRTVDGLRGPDIRPWASYKEASEVCVKAVIGDKLRTIVRSHTPNLLTLDGKECQQATLDKLLGQSLEFMTSTIILGQGRPLFFNLSAKDKMDLFSEVLSLDRWERMSDHAKDKLADRQAKLSELLSEKVSFDEQLKMLRDLVEAAKSKHDKWEVERAKQILAIENQLKTVEREQAANQKRLDKATLEADTAGTEAKALVKEIDGRQADLATARHFYNKHEAGLELARVEYRRLKSDLKELGEGSECPTCKQSLKGTNLLKHRKALAAQLERRKTILDAGVPEEEIAKVSLAQKNLAASMERRDKFLEQEDAARATINRCAPIAGECKGRMDTLKRERAQLEDGNNPFRSELTDLRRRRERLKEQQTELLTDKKKLDALIARTKFWVKGFKDIRLYVIEDVLKQLEFATNAMLQEVGLHKWKVQYAIDSETKSGKVRHGLNVSILSPKNKTPVKWECWSGGEGRRLLIVGSLALSKVLLDYVGIETNLEVLDEPTQFIGEEGIEDLIEYLADRARRLGKTIIYVDHGARESAQFTSTIRVVKDKHGSRIV